MKKTARFYKQNPESAAKKRAYQKEYNKKPSEIRKRTALNKYNREKGTYGNGDKLDATHRGTKIVGFEHQSKNRGSSSNSAGDKRARPKKPKR